MPIKRLALLALLLALVTSPLASAVQSAFSYLLPVDSTIGQVIEPEEGSVELLTLQALGSPYDPAWLESYVPGELHQSFVHTYDQLLASLLPIRDVLIGKAILRGTLYEVPFRTLSGRLATGSFVWYLDEDGETFLVSLSLMYEQP